MFYLKPGSIIPDDVPIAALTNDYPQWQDLTETTSLTDSTGAASRGPQHTGPCTWRNHRHLAPELADLPPERTKLQVEITTGFWTITDPAANIAHAYTADKLTGIASCQLWEKIPTYSSSSPTEKMVIQGLVGIFLYSQQGSQQE